VVPYMPTTIQMLVTGQNTTEGEDKFTHLKHAALSTCRGVMLCVVKEEKRKSSTSIQLSANAPIITRE